MSAPHAKTITLNLFQHPFLRLVTPVQVEEWMLKQVQHDGEEAAE
jgi:hypothetical protein